jgi:hypothetical protein
MQLYGVPCARIGSRRAAALAAGGFARTHLRVAALEAAVEHQLRAAAHFGDARGEALGPAAAAPALRPLCRACLGGDELEPLGVAARTLKLRAKLASSSS